MAGQDPPRGFVEVREPAAVGIDLVEPLDHRARPERAGLAAALALPGRRPETLDQDQRAEHLGEEPRVLRRDLSAEAVADEHRLLELEPAIAARTSSMKCGSA